MKRIEDRTKKWHRKFAGCLAVLLLLAGLVSGCQNGKEAENLPLSVYFYGIMMLGTPYQEEVSSLHERDVCLLQVDEDDRWGLRFYDCGMYYFFVPARDLCRMKFDNASGELFYY